jgi:outer membrane protein
LNSFIKVLSLAAILSLATMSGAVKAEQKFAVVNVQQVLQALPQVAVIEQNINAEFAEQIQEVQRLRSDGNFLLEKLQREKATMSADQIKELEEQVNTLGQQLQAKGQPLQQNMQRRTEEERRKLFALIQQAIDAIANKDGYDMVLNSNAVPFSDAKFDISEEVLTQVSKIN